MLKPDYIDFRTPLRAAWLLAILMVPPFGLHAQPEMDLPPQTEKRWEIGRALDSIKRFEEKKLFTSEVMEDTRLCHRYKNEFLQDQRQKSGKYTELREKINLVKQEGRNPGDPEVEALMEEKFQLETLFNQRYLATPRGKECEDRQDKRSRRLEKLLEKNSHYQRLLLELESFANQPPS